MKLHKKVLMLLGGGLIFSMAAIISGLVYISKLDQVAHIEKIDIDEAKLHSIATAIDLYAIKNKMLPQDEKVRELLLREEFIVKDNVFYSEYSDKLFRYYSCGEKYVLVSPGKNRKYDSPEGYENLKEFKEKTDDIIRFSN